MKNLKLKLAFIALIGMFIFTAPTESLAQARHHQGQNYNQGYDDAYGRRGDSRHRGRMHRRYAPGRRFVAPPPPPFVRHHRMARRMAYRHHFGWCGTAPRPRHRCR